MQAADVDGDGDVDVVTPEYDIGRIAWYRNPYIGGGGWTAVPIGTGVTAHDVEVADMNGDTKIDVVIRGHFGPTTPYLQSNPVTWTPVGITAADDNEGTALADIDGDGRIDIVQNGYWLEAPDDPSDGGAWTKWSFDSSWEASTVGVAVVDLSGCFFRNNGGGLAWSLQVLSTNGSHNIRVADIGADGDLDVVGANWQGPPVELWENLLVP